MYSISICMCAYLSIESPTEHGFNAIFHFCIGIFVCILSVASFRTEKTMVSASVRKNRFVQLVYKQTNGYARGAFALD